MSEKRNKSEKENSIKWNQNILVRIFSLFRKKSVKRGRRKKYLVGVEELVQSENLQTSFVRRASNK
jgi:hypothetical protein